MKRFSVVPPTTRQIEALQSNLQKCIYLESAALLAGIPRRTLLDWIRLGRKGHPEYTGVVDMIDMENAVLSQKVLDPIVQQAFEGENMQALMFLYKARLQDSEKRFNTKLAAIEDEAEESVLEESGLSEDDIKAVEERALRALEASRNNQAH